MHKAAYKRITAKIPYILLVLKNTEVVYTEFLSVALTALISVAVMLVLVKLIGNRSISQMNMFDYINSITIGSIAAELATSDLKNMHLPLTAMLIFAGAVIIIAEIGCHCLPFRRFIEGRTIVLLENGKILDRNFKRAKININDFLMQCRLNGFFNLNDIAMAIEESNGRISFLPKASARPATPSDLKLVPGEDTVYYNIILDGHILEENLKNAGFNREWLNSQMKTNHVKTAEDVFIAVCNREGECRFYEKQTRKDRHDTFDT